MSKAILQMNNISKSFAGVQALKNVHFELSEGEVHALLGENGAGKSTLMKILMGIHQGDSGEILLENNSVLEKIQINNVRDSQRYGINMVFQELNLLENMTVSENIFLGRETTKVNTPFIDSKHLDSKAMKLLNRVELELSPSAMIGTLSVGVKQIIEIAKALSFDARIIILDEPTASLTEKESETLFSIIENLKNQGVSIVYISHRMDEIFRLSDRITILRDGSYIGTYNIENIRPEDIIKKMIGREIIVDHKDIKNISKKKILEINNIKLFKNSIPFNFDLHKGEILGFYGLVGAGRTELSEYIFGLRKAIQGEITVDGEKLEKHTPSEAMNHGIALIPEDRRFHGLIQEMSIRDNMILPLLNKLRSFFIDEKQLSDLVIEYQNKLNIVMSNDKQDVNKLSGGNQQKVVIAKWLATKPRILILDEPTRGIDVGAKAEIYKIIRNLSDLGMSIIIISSEMTEIINISHRILVMHEGNLTGELADERITEEAIITLGLC